MYFSHYLKCLIHLRGCELFQGLGKRLVLIYEMPHVRCSLFDLFELLMPSLDERLDLPAHGKSLV